MRMLFILLLTLFTPKSYSQSAIDVLHYRFHIALNDQNDTIYGAAHIRLVVNKKTPEIALDLTAKKPGGKGMLITALVENEKNVYPGPSFRHTGEKILINAAACKAGDTVTFTVNYKGIPDDGLIISKNKYGHRTFFADNWPDRGHHWLPCHDHPADKASVEFIVTAPDHYQVVANGIRVEETNDGNGFRTTKYREDVPLPPKIMVIGVADFAVNLAGFVNGCIPVYSWVYPEDRAKGFHDYALTTSILPWFIQNVGPYAYKKLANVQSKTTFGGLENASTIFYNENSVPGDGSEERLYAHEIAHQWFGNMATEKNFGHLWLSEGFATYFTILYIQNKYGKQKGMEMLLDDRDQVVRFARVSKNPVVDTVSAPMALLNPNSYQKGGWVLHMLHEELGDSAFWKGIRTYYASYAGKTAGTEDLQKVMESVSGKKLDVFFKQWLFTPGQPKLDISWKYLAGKKKLEVTVSQTQPSLFVFPLEIKYILPDGTEKTKRLDISKPSETFHLPLNDQPAAVEADPGVKLLWEGKLKEVK